LTFITTNIYFVGYSLYVGVKPLDILNAAGLAPRPRHF